jgi:type II restriction enzyme
MCLLTGWTKEVWECIKLLNKGEFELNELYSFTTRLKEIYPDNNHVEQKIQQQAQILVKNSYLERIQRGRYRLLRMPVSKNNKK